MKNRIKTFLFLIPVMMIAACNSGKEKEETEPKEIDRNRFEITSTQFESSGMELGELRQQNFHTTASANGVFEVPPQYKASVHPYYGGYVKRLDLLPGQKVNRGQVLFALENPEYIQIQQDYLEAKGQLKYLKSDYERQQNLAKDNIASQKSFLKAESDFKVVSARYHSLGKKLRLMGMEPDSVAEENLRSIITILSPISGFITRVNANIGSYVDPSNVVVEINDPEHLHLEIRIFERDLPKVKQGQEIIFRLQDNPEVSYEAEVYLVGKSIDTENRTIEVHGHLKNEQDKDLFNPGMYVEAEIQTSSEYLLSLPEEAVVNIEDLYYVLVLQEDNPDGFIFRKTEVTPGPSGKGYISIVNAKDFPEDTRFLTRGAFNLITE
ncbi:efflux RND transporter periplasmic adaptor subunit [Salinimicrobium flavum]|uniref:Efflux RND transporter periplasmic adaptor subunit n=1 Tax=Salinimicrobium flavum TaxID=1737065 RepID=A0ABW5IZB2_9FLAO